VPPDLKYFVGCEALVPIGRQEDAEEVSLHVDCLLCYLNQSKTGAKSVCGWKEKVPNCAKLVIQRSITLFPGSGLLTALLSGGPAQGVPHRRANQPLLLFFQVQGRNKHVCNLR
jgi:hypothetical protein